MHPHLLIIIITNILISMRGFKDAAFFDRYKFNIKALQNGDFKRALISGFLHVDLQHLLFNMLTLYFFAEIVIYELGVVSFYFVYLTSLIAGNLLSFTFIKGNPIIQRLGLVVQ